MGGARGWSKLTEQAENKKKKKAKQTEREQKCCKTKWCYVEIEVMGVK